MKRFKNFLLVSLCTLAVLALFAGCSLDGSMPVTPEEGSTTTIKKVDGLTLFRNGEVVAIMDQETIQGIVTAQLNKNSDVFEVEFFDENGEIINGDSQKYKLAWRNDPEYVSFEQHSDWKFCIYGKKPGNTYFELILENGGSADYFSPAIPLKVQ